MTGSNLLRIFAGSLLAATAVVPAQAERVGTAGAVNTRSVSTQPGGAEKVMEIGAQVVRNERIETSASGSMQIMFIDKTSLTIGPNSKITIDEFVYNPADGTGTMSVRLGRGLLRVVGGQVTHTGGATITTPAATIGVRGGIATVNHCTGQCDNPGTRAVLHFGALTVTPIGPGGVPTGASQSVTRPGFATFVAGQGQSGQANNASAPQRASQAEVGQTNNALNSQAGQSGGATSKPTDQGAGNAGVGTNVPSDASNVASRQGQNASSTSTASTSSTSSATSRSTQGAQQSAQQGQQGAATQTTASSSNQTTSASTTTTTGTGTTKPAQPTTPPAGTYAPQAFALTTTVDPSLGQNQVPFLTASFITNGETSVTTPIYGYRPAGTGSAPNANVMQANLLVTGKGTSQSSTISLMTGEISSSDPNGSRLNGGFSATRMAPMSAIGTASGVVSSSGTVPISSSGLPSTAFQYGSAAEINLGGATQGYVLTQTASPTPAPATLGQSRPDATLLGYTGGLMKTTRLDSLGQSSAVTTGLYYSNGIAVVSNVPGTGQMGATLIGFTTADNSNYLAIRTGNGPWTYNVPYSGTDPGLARNVPQAYSLTFGTAPIPDFSNVYQLGTGENGTPNFDPSQLTVAFNPASDGSRSAYIDAKTFGARSELALDQNLRVLKPTSGFSPDATYALTQERTPTNFLFDGVKSLFVTSDTVGANTTGFLSSISTGTVTPCDCEYTRWGFWTTDATSKDQLTGDLYATRTPINTWVAGTPSKTVDIPTVGEATYVGHAIATISNNGSSPYLASGTFNNVVNFGRGTGLVTIGNLDNATYQGSVALSTYAAGGFSGTINGTGGRTANVNGMFLQGGASNLAPKIGEMGGSIGLSGPNSYLGSGTFAAKLTSATGLPR